MQPAIHYVEIVSSSVNEQVASLQAVLGLEFGPALAEMGSARVAEAADGSLIGVRAPLAAHEEPIIRTYLRVADIHAAVKAAEANGALLAYPPTKQGEMGTWAIYILDDTQYGLWQPEP